MPEVVGTAVVNILPNTAGFAPALQRQMSTATAGMAGAGVAAGNATKMLTGLNAAQSLSVARANAVATSMRGATIAIGLFGYAGIKTAINFDTSLRRVEAITKGTEKQMDMLSQTAQKLGRDTQFTASQAADAMYYLALSGFKVNEINAATPGIVRLAAAGYVDLKDAADMAAMVLRSYQFQAEQIGRVNDVMANTFTRTNTDLRNLFDAFKYVGPIAKVAGLNFEEVNASLGLMADAGFRGSLGGTALRGAMTKLLNPTKEGAAVMEKYGIVTEDASGKLLPLVDIVRQFEKANVSAGDYMKIFQQRAGPGFAALVAQGSEKLERLTRSNMMAGKEVQTLSKFLDLNKKQVKALGDAFAASFPLVDAFGFNVDETSAVLASFVQNGKTASEATSLLAQAMAATKKQGFEKMIGATRDLDGRLVDSKGNVLGFIDVITILQSKGMTTEQAFAALGTEGLALAEVAKLDADALAEMYAETDKAGRAAEIMATQMAGIKGAGLRLKSSLEAVGITLFYETGFLDALAKAADAVAIGLNRLMETAPGLVKLVGGLLLFVGLIGPMAKLYVWIMRTWGILKVFAKFLIAFPVKHPIVVAIIAIVAAFVALYKNSEKLQKAIKRFFDTFRFMWKATFGKETEKDVDGVSKKVSIFSQALDALGNAFGWLGDRLAPVVEWLTRMLPGAFDLVARAMAKVQQAYEQYIKPWATQVGIILGQAWGNIKKIFSGIGDVIGSLFSGDEGKRAEGIGKIFDGIIDQVTRIAPLLYSKLGEVLRDWIGGAFQWAADNTKDIPVIGQWVSGLLGIIAGYFKLAGIGFDILSGLISGDPEKTRESIQKFRDEVKRIIKEEFPKVFEGIGNVLELAAKGAFALANADWVKDIPILGSIASAFFDGLGQAIKVAAATFDLIGAIFSGDDDKTAKAKEKLDRTILDGFKDWFSKLPGRVGDFAGDIGEALLKAIEAGLNWLSDNLPKLTAKINKFMSELFSGKGDGKGKGKGKGGLKEGIEKEGDGLIQWIFDTFLPKVLNAFQRLQSRLTPLLGQVLGAMLRLAWELGWASLNIFFAGMPQRIWNALKSAFTTAVQWLTRDLPNILQTVGIFFMTLPGKIGGWLSGLGAALGAAFMVAWNWVTQSLPSYIGGVVSFFRGLPGQIGSALGNLGSTLGNWISSAFNTARTFLANGIASLVNAARGLGSSILGAITGGLSAVGGAASTIASSIWGALKGFINSNVIDPLRGFTIPAGIPWFGGKQPFSGINRLAMGALVTSPEVALIGEAGPEVVLPLSRPMRALQLANEANLFDVFAQAASGASGTTAPTTAPQEQGMAEGVFRSGGAGNTYNIYGVSLAQVEAEIQARDAAALRVRR